MMKNVALTRSFQSNFGIFGALSDESDNQTFGVTLEHAYPYGSSLLPKFADGEYVCTRGLHRLEGMHESFETFCLDVPGHTNILIHPGNWNKDSEGCILIGKSITYSSNNWMITDSRQIFEEFMKNMTGIDRFKLEIKSAY